MSGRGFSAVDCLLRWLRDRALTEGYFIKGRDGLALDVLAGYASSLYDRGEAARCAAVLELRKLEAAGHAALESEAGQ